MGVERTVVVTADDFGLTAATSEACIRAHHDGIVTAVSVLGNGAASEATARLLLEAPGLAVGAHVALVGEDPPRSPAAEISTLVDGRGALRLTWRDLLRDVALQRVDLRHIRIEIEAQVRWLEETVGPLAHLNLHQHLQLWPSIGSIAVDVAVDRGIPFVRTPASSAAGPRGGAIRGLAHRLRRRCDEAGILTTEGFAGLDEAGAWDRDALRRALESGATSLEVNLHPGPAIDPDRQRFAWGYAWSGDLDLLCDPSTRSIAEAAGRTLVRPGAT